MIIILLPLRHDFMIKVTLIMTDKEGPTFSISNGLSSY